jgi:hypothetical protein
MFKKCFPKIVPLMRNVKKFDKIGHATDNNITRPIRIGCWINKATETHSKYLTLIAFPQQQWLTWARLYVALFVSFLSCFVSKVSNNTNFVMIFYGLTIYLDRKLSNY